jgi:hypothetical protein
LIALARISIINLSGSGVSGYLCLVPELKRNALRFLQLSMISALSSSLIAFNTLSYIPSILSCWAFCHEKVLNFVKCFSVSVEMIMWFFSFFLLVWCIIFIDLHMLKYPCTQDINNIQSWLMIFLLYYCICIWFASICVCVCVRAHVCSLLMTSSSTSQDLCFPKPGTAASSEIKLL